jgi:hypothetical protein
VQESWQGPQENCQGALEMRVQKWGIPKSWLFSLEKDEIYHYFFGGVA